MKRDIVEELSERLVGKAVTAVSASSLPESVCSVSMSDGKSFVLHANDLGAWVVDGPDSDGSFSSIGALAVAVEACRSAHGADVIEGFRRAVVTSTPDLVTVEVVPGDSFSIRLSKVADEWERKVLSHPDVLSYIGRVVETSDFWRSWFNGKEGYDPWIDGDREIIPDDLIPDDLKSV